jgi:hypothetical protein
VSALRRLAETVRRDGGALARSVPADVPDVPGPGAEAAAGPRTVAARDEYELVVEAIREGYLLHYGGSRALRVDDPDLALLAGDRLYALGLARLVELGDLAAVAELADVIGLAALARAGQDVELAEAVWAAGAHAIGWGGSERHERAKALAGAGDPGAAAALRGAGRRGPPANAGR